jgi:hypothetical protein
MSITGIELSKKGSEACMREEANRFVMAIVPKKRFLLRVLIKNFGYKKIKIF